jgi:hypothetical protein
MERGQAVTILLKGLHPASAASMTSEDDLLAYTWECDALLAAVQYRVSKLIDGRTELVPIIDRATATSQIKFAVDGDSGSQEFEGDSRFWDHVWNEIVVQLNLRPWCWVLPVIHESVDGEGPFQFFRVSE